MAGTVSGGNGVSKAVGIGCGCFIVIVVFWLCMTVLGWAIWMFRDMFYNPFQPGERGGYTNVTLDRAYERERAFDAEVYDRAADEEIDVPQELLQAHKKAFVEVQRELKKRMDQQGRQKAYHWLATETRHGRRRADPEPIDPDQPQPSESRPKLIPQRRAVAPPKPGPTLLEEYK